MRCNLTEAEQKAALGVPFACTGEEQEFIERCFSGYLFFEREQNEMGRDGVSTECTRCGRKVWWTDREWKDFKRQHGAKERSCVMCPDCGKDVTLYARGRLLNGNSLDEYRQIVLLRVLDGALRAVALLARKHHGRWESDAAEADVKAAYYFTEGKCQKWKRQWVWSGEQYVPKLVPQKSMTEPFADCQCWNCYKPGYYAVHGVDQIAASPLKYCAAEQFFNLYDDDTREITMGLLTYLGLWTRYPRVDANAMVLARYLEKHQHKNAALWLDYIDAAKKLGYDLARRDVAFPKNLQGAHDSAIAAIRYEENEAARKAYEKKYQKLVKKYSFTAMGLSVVVPEDDRQIINEGKILHHCVGGYAERHMAGAATILFLRKEKTPWRSYITIEMCGKKGNDIRQIHGYRNENKAGKRLATPGERHGEFLDLWLAWLNNGSKRDKNGRPVLPVKGEKTA